MKRAFVVEYGNPEEAVEVRVAPDPIAGEGEVVVEKRTDCEPAGLVDRKGKGGGHWQGVGYTLAAADSCPSRLAHTRGLVSVGYFWPTGGGRK